ncbi:hypothetical protein PVAP13_2KG065300 [Panicum virgatum]|uniref:Phytocyanin domain-containing protein n=1 Tax=Panicum virgatum TaxID=38727 RepID=A0A8T0W0F1_PANVG|nr:hypothetical protein PVAP13_2KG065300 [Panicum virgatum]
MGVRAPGRWFGAPPPLGTRGVTGPVPEQGAAGKRRLLIGAVAVLFAVGAAAAAALAADLLVGDGKGWHLDVEYDEWVDGNEFFVGDTLVFKYTKGSHSVVEATAAGFAACSAANRQQPRDVGLRRRQAGVSSDCVQGMRFNVTVLPVVKLSPSTSSLPPSSAPCSGGGMAPALAAAAVAAASLLF